MRVGATGSVGNFVHGGKYGGLGCVLVEIEFTCDGRAVKNNSASQLSDNQRRLLNCKKWIFIS
jgi:hypothetical protein